MDFEVLWYEASPYIYVIVGIIAMIYASSYLAMLPGGLLIAAAVTILRMRRSYRRAQEVEVKRRF